MPRTPEYVIQFATPAKLAYYRQNHWEQPYRTNLKLDFADAWKATRHDPVMRRKVIAAVRSVEGFWSRDLPAVQDLMRAIRTWRIHRIGRLRLLRLYLHRQITLLGQA